MSFTDDNMKELKHILEWEDKYVKRDEIFEFLPPLIARLEAAEWLAGMADGPQDAIDAWHKACGK